MNVFTFWFLVRIVNFPFLSRRGCVCAGLIGVLRDPVAPCLEDWHNNTGSQRLSERNGENPAENTKTKPEFS